MHHFIVAQDEDEVFLERIHQRERDVVVVVAPENRIERHVMEEVVHPPHVPFEAEPEPAEMRRARHARPGS